MGINVASKKRVIRVCRLNRDNESICDTSVQRDFACVILHKATARLRIRCVATTGQTSYRAKQDIQKHIQTMHYQNINIPIAVRVVVIVMKRS